MDDEINLRQYWLTLLRNWVLIAAFAFVAAAATAGVSLLIPNQYAAVALVSLAPPRNSLRLDDVNQSDVLPVRAYPELALTNDLVAELYAKVAPLLPERVNSPALLQERLSAEATPDLSLLRLRVKDIDPERAAAIANLWAGLFSASSAKLYAQDRANMALYEQQLAEAEVKLEQAENELAAFQSTNQVAILTAQLNSQQDSLTDNLDRQHQLGLLARDISDIVARLNALAPEEPARLSEDLALLSITSRIYGAQIVDGNADRSQIALPLQVQIGSGQPLAGPAVADQRVYAQTLADAIAARLADITQESSNLQAQILVLQGQVAEAQVRAAQLTRVNDLADDEYTRLAHAIQESRLAVQESANAIQIVSSAAVPTIKTGPYRTLNTLLGGAIGVVFGILVALGLDFWRRSSKAAEGGQPARSKEAERLVPAPAPK